MIIYYILNIFANMYMKCINLSKFNLFFKILVYNKFLNIRINKIYIKLEKMLFTIEPYYRQLIFLLCKYLTFEFS